MGEVVLVALLLLVAVAGVSWLLGDLRRVPRNTSRSGAGVAVVVPARDEEATLPALLASLRELRTPPVEVVVVDDDSRDATAPVARAGGAVVLSPGDPPPGWTGKAWACHAGADATTSDLLLFLDADTTLAPDALDGLLALHDRHGGLVSVQPFHAVQRGYEQLSAYFNAVAVLASGAFAHGRGARPMAFGPCLLTSRSDYERVGGHAAVRSAILDDAELAAAYDRAGLPVTCAVGAQAIRMRSYPGGLRQLADGWTKNFASGAAAAPMTASVATVLWICAHHAVAVGAVSAVVGWDGSAATLAAWGLVWACVSWHLRTVLRNLGAFAGWSWVLFPLPLLAFDVIFARSAVLTAVRRSVRWRGREVALHRHGSAEEVI
jgi:4,4'-diaponeurosporenoate glycosyltransferase